MFNLHIKEELSTVRVFAEGDTYEDKQSPLFSCTMHYISDTEVYICSARGKIPAGGFAFFMKKLKEEGITLVRYERHKKMKTLHL